MEDKCICGCPLTDYMQDYCSEACELQAWAEARIENAILRSEYESLLGVK